jgi:sulfate transport system ATP-binding protein
VRRVHALPTPISSFRLMTTDSAEADALESNPLLAQLVRSMQARVIRHQDKDSGDERLDAGICVLRLDGDTPAAVAATMAQGARRILCVPAGTALPASLLVHTRDAARRSDLLALVSSVMRHLPVAATVVTLERPEASRSELAEAQRTLLDTRAGLRGAHGLDLRGDRVVGDLKSWLRQVAARTEPVLVVLGLQSSSSAASELLAGDLGALFNADSRAAVLFAVEAAP